MEFPCLLKHAARIGRGMPDHHPELQALRSLRNKHLRSRPDGETWILRYRASSEKLIALIDSMPNAAAHYELILRELLDPLKRRCRKDPEGALALGLATFERLERHYLRNKNRA